MSTDVVLVQIVAMGPVFQTISLVAVDSTFILSATAFLSTGSLLGTQRYGRVAKYPGDNLLVHCMSVPTAAKHVRLLHGHNMHDVHHVICCNYYGNLAIPLVFAHLNL